MNVISVIPARGGSKGIPKKNIIDVAGKPLLCWTIEAALTAQNISEVIVSTDDPEIANIAKEAGAKVPFLRPIEYAHDQAGALPVIQHVMSWLEDNNIEYDAIAYLQPTSPLRTAIDIDEAVQLLGHVDTVVSVCKVPHNMSPSSLMILNEQGGLDFSVSRQNLTLRRQDKKDRGQFYARNGPAILISKKFVYQEGDIYGAEIAPYEMPYHKSFDIDDYEDLNLVRKLLS